MLNELCPDATATAEMFYNTLERCNALKNNYFDYMTTHPIDCDAELLRLPDANYDLCCALITMLLREDYFSNGSFEHRQRKGEVCPIIKRMISLLSVETTPKISEFSEKAISALNGFYVYALIDPRNDSVFYIGKGTGNRVFSHEIESDKSPKSEKTKLHRIREIEKEGFEVKRLLINWGLTESEAFVAEATLINFMNAISEKSLTNMVAGHHVHESLTVEEFELMYGAERLKPEDIKHSILVIKINKLYRRDMSDYEIYDTVRGMWKASLKSIKARNVQYVFAVYNGLIVGVYKPDEWHYAHERIDLPQHNLIDEDAFERLKDRVYFVCKDYSMLDEEGKAYLHKSIAALKFNQSAQNPITYLSPTK
jgi:hypothetical protein